MLYVFCGCTTHGPNSVVVHRHVRVEQNVPCNEGECGLKVPELYKAHQVGSKQATERRSWSDRDDLSKVQEYQPIKD